MATRYLGPTIDIHGGGSDLIFPHHECEIAQTEPVTGEVPFARYWVHTAMVEYQGTKMSKSLGNLVLVRDVLRDFSADAIRLYALSNHYRTPWEFRDDAIDRWAQMAADLREATDLPAYGIEEEVDVSAFRERFYNAMDDDLNTPVALEALAEVGQAILVAPDDDDVRDALATLREMADILGLTLGEPT
jgi:cysteinyl-tRNA synthetase